MGFFKRVFSRAFLAIVVKHILAENSKKVNTSVGIPGVSFLKLLVEF